MKRFGLKAPVIRELVKTFPELQNIKVAETSFEDTARIILNCMALRLIVQPDPKSVEAMTILGDYLSAREKKQRINDEYSLWS